MGRWRIYVPEGQATPQLELVKLGFANLIASHPDRVISATRLDGIGWDLDPQVPLSHVLSDEDPVDDAPLELAVGPHREREGIKELETLASLAMAELERLGVRIQTPVGTQTLERWVYFVTEVLGSDQAYRTRLEDCGFHRLSRNCIYRVENFTKASLLALERAFATPAPKPRASVCHSEDFTSVDWFGQLHQFAKGRQAETVKALWREFEKRPGFGLSEKTIGAMVDSQADNFRLEHVFRGHPTWRQFIRPIAKGVFALVTPEILASTREAQAAHRLAHEANVKLRA